MYKLLFVLAFILSFWAYQPLFAQHLNNEVIEPNYQKRFVIKPGINAQYSIPQKYGGTIDLYFGNRFEEKRDATNYSPHYDLFLRAVSIEGSLNRGGYNFGVAYSKLDAYVGTVGLKYGVYYYSNNSFSSVKKRMDFFGPRISLHLITFELSAGVLKQLEGNSFIPTVGFGMRLGPDLYD